MTDYEKVKAELVSEAIVLVRKIAKLVDEATEAIKQERAK